MELFLIGGGGDAEKVSTVTEDLQRNKNTGVIKLVAL